MGIGLTALLYRLTESSGAGGLLMLPMLFTVRSAFRLVAPVRAAVWQRRQVARREAVEARGTSWRGLIFSWVIVLGFVALGAWLLMDEFSSRHAPSFWHDLLIVGGSGALFALMIHETQKYHRRL